ncbi:MAG TPA: response regulator [Nitrolancea sp.]|nr:response regulator [Nitrolancea sp.]
MKLGAIVVSDHKRFRKDLAQLVELVDPCVEVIGEVSNARETLHQIELLRPALVLLDLGLCCVDTLELVECIHAAWPATAIVVIGNELAAEYRQPSLAAGAVEYVDVLEIATQLPAALLLVEHPNDCGAPEIAQLPANIPDAPDVIDQIAMFVGRLRTAPTGPKRGPRTAWQYVHLCLVLALVPVLWSLHQKADLGLQRSLLLTLSLVGIAIIEARQFARARHPGNPGCQATS